MRIKCAVCFIIYFVFAAVVGLMLLSLALGAVRLYMYGENYKPGFFSIAMVVVWAGAMAHIAREGYEAEMKKLKHNTAT